MHYTEIIMLQQKKSIFLSRVLKVCAWLIKLPILDDFLTHLIQLPYIYDDILFNKLITCMKETETEKFHNAEGFISWCLRFNNYNPIVLMWNFQSLNL